MTDSKLRGHEILYKGKEWVYKDNNEPTVNNERSCGHCSKDNTQEGHDGCLGTLPNVMNACCGHGETKEAYVQFSKDNCIRGEGALLWFIKNKEN